MQAKKSPNKSIDSVSIEPASWRDILAIYRLEKICFSQDAWPIWDVVGVLVLPNIVRLKAVDGETLVGFIMGDIRRRKAEAWIATFCVAPGYRQQGVGSTLLEMCESQIDMERIKLSVRVSNKSAIRLYERFGYKVVGTWMNYYRGGEDALVMEKSK